MLKKTVNAFFGLAGLQVNRKMPPPPPPKNNVLSLYDHIPLWDTNPEYDALRKRIEGRTILTRMETFFLYQFSKQIRSLPGDIAEIGVYRGGTARLWAEMAPGRTVHLFDTFTGMPETDPEKDQHKAGDFSDTSLEGVKNFLHGCDNVLFHQGFFPATSGPVIDKQFCLVHVDVDIYKSVLDCCEFFYPRLVKGGIMAFDDYGRSTCPGAMQAVDQFFKDKPESPFYFPTAQCFITKL